MTTEQKIIRAFNKGKKIEWARGEAPKNERICHDWTKNDGVPTFINSNGFL